jgi:hypothetical protein
VASMGEDRKVFKVLVGKSEGKHHLEDQRWDQNGSWGDRLRGVEWIQLAQDRGQWRAVLTAVMNLWVLAPRS